MWQMVSRPWKRLMRPWWWNPWACLYWAVGSAALAASVLLGLVLALLDELPPITNTQNKNVADPSEHYWHRRQAKSGWMTHQSKIVHWERWRKCPNAKPQSHTCKPMHEYHNTGNLDQHVHLYSANKPSSATIKTRAGPSRSMALPMNGEAIPPLWNQDKGNAMRLLQATCVIKSCW